MATAVLDSSVVLAALNGEPGGEAAAAFFPNALLSSVNLGEIVTKLTERGLTRGAVQDIVGLLDCEIVPFDAAQAMEVGFLRAPTRARGLSFGDRACLGLGLARGLPVYTADRPWSDLDLGVEIRQIR